MTSSCSCLCAMIDNQSVLVPWLGIIVFSGKTKEKCMALTNKARRTETHPFMEVTRSAPASVGTCGSIFCRTVAAYPSFSYALLAPSTPEIAIAVRSEVVCCKFLALRHLVLFDSFCFYTKPENINKCRSSAVRVRVRNGQRTAHIPEM